ncbi:MAG: heme-binding domain-containing protein [Bacteroidetes bacterium]|nr:heme-binding domain-containing protein [Bacteroidota bacterium]
MRKKLFYPLLLGFIIIQFMRPERNEGIGSKNDDIQFAFQVNQSVHSILKRSCYDCHSDHTSYPWYANVQPAGWWIQHHIEEGKSHLNFSTFKTYTPAEMDHKLEEIKEVIEENEMPLKSYRLLHSKASLSENEKQALLSWVTESRKRLNLSHHFNSEYKEDEQEY